MVIGLFEDTSHAEIALNNLAEAEFRNKDISVIMKDNHSVGVIAGAKGALNGAFSPQKAESMVERGLTGSDLKTIHSQLEKGGVAIVVNGPMESDDVAAEMLTDNQASLVRILSENL